MRYYRIIVVVLLVSIVFSGCAKKESTRVLEDDIEQVLIWNIGSNPKTIDPGLNSATDAANVINNTFEGLMREVGGQLELAMAESYEVSEDGLVYRFNIRDRAKWSDGKPVSAYDFEYAWNRVSDPEIASEYAEIFNEVNIESWRAVNGSQFEVVLTVPTTFFLEATSSFSFMPVRKDIVEHSNGGRWARNPETAISNGPFKLTTYVDGDKIILEPNEYYWKREEVKLDRIEALMIVDQSTGLSGYESGKIHIIDSIPSNEIPRLLVEEPTFMILPYDAVYYYAFNTKVPPIDDIRVRKALSLAIDRMAIVDTVTKSAEKPTSTLIPQMSFNSDTNTFERVSESYKSLSLAQVEEAQNLLAQAGYPNGDKFPVLEVLYNTSENHKAIAEAIQEMWKRNLGIHVRLANQEWATFQTSRINRNFQIARAGWLADYSDPMAYLSLFTSFSQNNYSQWESQEYDDLIAASKGVAGNDRYKLLYEAADLLNSSYAIMPIFYYADALLVSEKVDGWEKTNRSALYFGKASIAADQ